MDSERFSDWISNVAVCFISEFYINLWPIKYEQSKQTYVFTYHTAGSDTIFVQIYMDPPPEVPRVSTDAPGSTKNAILGLVR